ncbi:hypothetical protein Tco_1553757 [Tanacetum coccineum]
MDKLLKEVLMIDELSIVETNKVNHTMEMDMLKLVVEVECFGKCIDEFDKVTVLFGEMQLKQEDRSYVHASNKLHLHVVHVVPTGVMVMILKDQQEGCRFLKMQHRNRSVAIGIWAHIQINTARGYIYCWVYKQQVLDVDASLLDAYDWAICCDGSSIGSSRLMMLVCVYAANTSLLLSDFINSCINCNCRCPCCVPTTILEDDNLQLPVETPKNPFVAPANIHTIEAFMNRVGYQGVVDKVSAFFTKNLAQPWQTMFKVFNCYLTPRTSSHDQTKINILQLFHVVINRTHVDYAALLWWYFMNNMFQKKEAIQYPRFTKVIITDLIKKFPNIPKRIDENYHSIKDDIPLVSVYITRNVLVRGMLILDAFLTAEIKETADFKEYETIFMKVVFLMNQPQPVVSTQGTNRNTPRAPTTTTSKHSQVNKRISSKYSHLPGALRRMCRRQANITIDDCDAFSSEVPAFVSQEFNAHAPAIIEENFKNYMKRNLQDRADDIALWEALRRKFEKSSSLNTSCKEDDFHSHHDEHHDDEGEKSEKK